MGQCLYSYCYKRESTPVITSDMWWQTSRLRTDWLLGKLCYKPGGGSRGWGSVCIPTATEENLHKSLLQACGGRLPGSEQTGFQVNFVTSPGVGVGGGAVFVFLLLQKRIYTSHYFRHVVADFQAQNRLASR